MDFDIIPLTKDQIENLSVVQTQLLRTAQKKKNEMKKQLAANIAAYKRTLMGRNMKNSSLLEQKTAQLNADYEEELGILIEQLNYSLTLNAPIPADEADPKVGYIVDYSLSYNERYVIVRDFYLAMQDPVERLNIYSADDVAKKYLDSYYSTLWQLLYRYSQT